MLVNVVAEAEDLVLPLLMQFPDLVFNLQYVAGVRFVRPSLLARMSSLLARM